MKDHRDPYAPSGRRRVREVTDPMTAFLHRLEACGAPADVIENARVHWHDVTDPEDLAARDQLIAMSDLELREAIRAVQDEDAVNTMTEVEQADVELLAVAQHISEAQAKIGESVASLREWIGDNRARAVAVWIAERDGSSTDRKTLMEYVEGMAGDWLDRSGLRD